MQIHASPAVRAARAGNRPIVALESTIIAHGLPWPANLAVARELEAAVTAGGAVPATIAIIEGHACVGLGDAALEHLAREGARFAKAGAADLAVHVARGTSAATTVSGTSMIAAAAGIQVFATGGIGGVHRGDSGDVSHDLYALARTPIAIVSAGAKAILDLPRTLELLETLGVLVVGFRTSEFPAFYTPSSGLPIEHRVESATELAAIVNRRWAELGGGVLVCNPIPLAEALDARMIESAISAALADAAVDQITGKRLTPYLMTRLATVTGGASIQANRALAVHNAQVAAALAVACAQEIHYEI